MRRDVALKVIKLGMDTREVVARFEAERQALALMEHPGIARVFDGGATRTGRPYLVMELVRGAPITQFCDEHALPLRERLELFIAVCEAVQHAHQKGIIHRDLKPSNILVAGSGRESECERGGSDSSSASLSPSLSPGTPKVIDFGIAKAIPQLRDRLTDVTLRTAVHSFLGTPAYMSPEQTDPGNIDIDTRSDIYSLGVILYELLTGETPIDRGSLASSNYEELREKIRTVEPLRPSLRMRHRSGAGKTENNGAEPRPVVAARDLEGDLDWIVLRCLEKDRARRYATANALALDLRRHLRHEPVAARPPSAGYVLARIVRRHRAAVAAAAAVATILVLASAVSTWQALRALQAEREQSRLRVAAEAQALAMRRQAYTSDMNLAQQAIAAENLGRARGLLNRHRPGPGETDLRGWEWRYLWQLSRSEARAAIGKVTYQVNNVVASADGRWVAAAEWSGGGLTVWNRATGETTRVPLGLGSTRIALSPTAPLLAVSATPADATAGQRRLWLWNLETRQIVRELPAPGAPAGLYFSADGSRLLTAGGGSVEEIVLWRVADGMVIARIPAPGIGIADRFSTVAATAGLDRAAYATVDGGLHLVDLLTGQRRWTVRGAEERLLALAFSPDGTTLASGAGYVESAIRLWEVASGRERGRLEGHTRFVTHLVFSADGSTLYSAGGDHTIRVWDVGAGSLRRTLRGHTAGVWTLALLPDGRSLVSGGSEGAVHLWDLQAPAWSPVVALTGRPMAWHFAGPGEVLTVGPAGRVIRHRGPQWAEQATLLQVHPAPDRQHDAPVFSADGTLLAQGAPVSPEAPGARISVWDWERAVLVTEISTGLPERVTVLKITPQRRSVLGVAGFATSPAPVLREWEISTGREIGAWPLPAVTGQKSITLSADGWQAVLLNAEERHVHLDRRTGRQTPLRIDLRRTPGLRGGAFSHDGRLFAAPSYSGWLRLFDLSRSDFPEIATLHESAHTFHGVTFSPDDQRMVTGSDGVSALYVWEVHSRQPVLVLAGTGSAFMDPRFSPDGNLLGCTSGIGTTGLLTLWRAPSWAEIAAAEAGP